MHLPWCIFMVGMAFLGAVSVRIGAKVSKIDKCLTEMGKQAVKIEKCDNSTSQNWIVDGDHIKNEKLQEQCLAIDRESQSVGDAKLSNCEFRPSIDNKNLNENATNVRKMRIEGIEVKNYRNECLYFGFRRVAFYSCEKNDTLYKKAHVV
jgi:hypothetical protein